MSVRNFFTKKFRKISLTTIFYIDKIKFVKVVDYMKMKHLAELAGVSPSTVSKAFSGSREISEEKDSIFFK